MSKKMTRNRRKMIGKTADSLLCPLHSIQFLPPCLYLAITAGVFLFCIVFTLSITKFDPAYIQTPEVNHFEQPRNLK